MKKTRFTESQIAVALKGHRAVKIVLDICLNLKLIVPLSETGRTIVQVWIQSFCGSIKRFRERTLNLRGFSSL